MEVTCGRKSFEPLARAVSYGVDTEPFEAKTAGYSGPIFTSDNYAEKHPELLHHLMQSLFIPRTIEVYLFNHKLML